MIEKIVYTTTRTIALIFILFLVSPLPQVFPATKEISLLFMYDDFCNRSTGELEIKLINTFKKNRIPCTFVVIPFPNGGDSHDPKPADLTPLSPVKVDILRNGLQAGILEIGQHGLSHQAVRRSISKSPSEFSGLDYHAQLAKIASGKNHLEKILGSPIATFIPTWNSYDLNTIQALEDLGFQSISAIEYGIEKENSTLRFLPVTCRLYQLPLAVTSARRGGDPQPIIVVLFNERDITGINKITGISKYHEFEKLLAWIKSQKDIRVRKVSDTIRQVKDLGPGRFQKYNAYLSLSHYLYPVIPRPILTRFFPHGVYLSSSSANTARIKLGVFVFLFYSLILVISFVLGFFVGNISFSWSRLAVFSFRYVPLFLTIFFCAYAFREVDFSFNKLVLEISQLHGRPYYRFIIPLVACIGMSMGIWTSFLKFKKDSQLNI